MTLPRSTPEEQGVSSIALGRFVDALEHNVTGVHSLMLVRHGHVIAEGWWAPYRADLPHSLFSISKSFLSTAIGFAVDEGLLTIDDAVVDLLPDDLPDTVSDNITALRVRHLLTMTTGHAVDTVSAVDHGDDWARQILAQPLVHTPGSVFVYNSGASYLLSALLQRLTGQRVLDYLTPRLFDPLGITGASWEQCPRGIDAGGWGLSLTTEQIALFGETYLRDGVFAGRQVVPAAWVRAATSLQVDNADAAAPADNGQGYGFQFWRNRHASYRADGAFGQLSIALPDHDAVLVVTGGIADTPRALDVVWEHLLPVLGPGSKTADATSAAALTHRLGALSLPLPSGDEHSPTAARVGGVRYTFAKNGLGIEYLALDLGDDASRLTLVDTHGSHEISCGAGAWTGGRSTLLSGDDAPYAAAGAWADDDSYLATVHFTTTPFALTISLDFRADEVTVNVEQNVSFGPTRLLHTVGAIEKINQE